MFWPLFRRTPLPLSITDFHPMPIKFACPKCQNVLSVSSKLAGKKGKCKCGNEVLVPTPSAKKKQASGATATQPTTSAMAAVLEELTESDFNRESPMKQIYEKKVGSSEGAQLRKFEGEEVQTARKNTGKLGGGMIFLAILNMIEAVGLIAIVIILLVKADVIEKLSEAIPEFRLASWFVITGCSVGLIFLLGGAIGTLMKKPWGWFFMAVVYSFNLINRLAGLGLIFMTGFTQPKFFGGLIPLLVAFGFMGIVFNEKSQAACKVNSTIVSVTAGILGVLLAGGLVGAMFAMGVFKDPTAGV